MIDYLDRLQRAIGESPIVASEARHLYERLIVALVSRRADLPEEFTSRLEWIATSGESADWQVRELGKLLDQLPCSH